MIDAYALMLCWRVPSTYVFIYSLHGFSPGGCNGYSYTMDYALQSENLKKFEEVESHGVKVFVDPPAIFYILGTEMDYVETALSTEFTFVNPNSKGECGCGESFNV